jgi:hypothetical protein
MYKTKKPKPKSKVQKQQEIKTLAETLDIEFKNIVTLIPLPNGAVAYKDYIIKQTKTGSWGIFIKRTADDCHGEFNLKTCALIAAKALSGLRLQHYNEIKQLDTKYWSNYYRSTVYQHNIKTVKDMERYLILLNKLEDSKWKASHYKDEISKLFRWAFV